MLNLRGPEENPGSTLGWKKYLQMPNEVSLQPVTSHINDAAALERRKRGVILKEDRLVGVEAMYFSKQVVMEQAQLRH